MKGLSPSFIDAVLGNRIQNTDEAEVNAIVIDSRNINQRNRFLFIALTGSLRDGHDFIKDSLKRGCKNFIISRENELAILPNTNVWLVKDSKSALQVLAKAYRDTFNLEVIGITGSNGKTTVKEWLAHFLSFDQIVAKSPGSYNSQIGVPLSMFEIEHDSEIGVFEAGISTVGEMENLASIINPSIGIFTNIGEAHSGGFERKEQKIEEKLKLFAKVKSLVICADHQLITHAISRLGWEDKVKSWGMAPESSLFKIVELRRKAESTETTILYQGDCYSFSARISDEGSIENLFHCLATMLILGKDIHRAIDLSKGLFQIPMRLEMVRGSYSNTLINDAYNHDLTSLKNALDFFKKQKGSQKGIVILTDIYESRMTPEHLQDALSKLIKEADVDKVYWLGSQGATFANNVFGDKVSLERFLENEFISDSCILIKGARRHQLDTLNAMFLSQRHTSTLTIDLGAFNHNVQRYAKELRKEVNMIAVVKAGAYGSGSVELARILQNRGIAYLAVAFCDEAIELRKSGIIMPIMILNSDPNSYPSFKPNQLEPVIYSMSQLIGFISYCNHFKQNIAVHIKIDSGMNRLGFVPNEIIECGKRIVDGEITVKSVFSHLAGSENELEDSNTHHQVETFLKSYEALTRIIKAKPPKHILNTGGILRFPEYQFDFVRLGLGMYGVDTTKQIENDLEKVHTFEALVIQTKTVKKGSKIGYNQKGIINHDGRIAIVNIGYADGLPRQAGLGKFSLICEGIHCPIIGQVCMDLTIIDVTNCPECKEGSVVEIFGKFNPIEKLAEVSGTIPYEVLARISKRITKKWVID